MTKKSEEEVSKPFIKVWTHLPDQPLLGWNYNHTNSQEKIDNDSRYVLFDNVTCKTIT